MSEENHDIETAPEEAEANAIASLDLQEDEEIVSTVDESEPRIEVKRHGTGRIMILKRELAKYKAKGFVEVDKELGSFKHGDS